MIFGKKKKMVDVRELQKRGVVRLPKDEIVVPTNSDGFVELNSSGISKPETQNTSEISKTTTESSSSSNADFFGFMDTTTPATSSSDSFSTSVDGYNKREVDQKVVDLDNKIYKLEQRIELLEKKLDVNHNSNPSTGPMGW